MTDKKLKPVLKWVGGKRQLLKTFEPLFPTSFDFYAEPFVGGGAVFLHLSPDNALISDINKDIINLYQIIKDDIDGLLSTMSQFSNDKECYYNTKAWDKDPNFESRSSVEKAARTLFLNRTCFNGVYRVNQKGYFNVPFGRYKHPLDLDTQNLYALNAYFNEKNITFKNYSYEYTLKELPENSFVYLDPPYDPISPTAAFTSYSKNGFNQEDQINLRKYCDELNKKGIKFMLSNSATEFIKKQYQNYNINIVKAKRMINRDGTGRGAVDEVVIRNYS